MGVRKILARKWLFEIDADQVKETPTDTATWTKIGGLNTFTLGNDAEQTDTTDFDSDGHSEHMITQRSKEISFEGYYLEDESDGARDPGQQAVEDAAELIGQRSLVPLRVTSPSGKVQQFLGSVSIGDVGGGNNDATSWGATYTKSGKPVTVTP